MIRIVYADEAADFPRLFSSMFKHRAAQFRDRLNWAVEVNADGHERDEYDRINPLYLILEAEDGSHAGSMRILPTTGNTMINDHFTGLTGGVTVKSPFIWECTRFCLAPNARRLASKKILMGTLEAGLHLGIQFYVGVFSKRMMRVYDRIGWSPVLIGEGALDGDTVCAGLWPISEAARQSILAREDDLSSPPEWLHFGTEIWKLGAIKEAA